MKIGLFEQQMTRIIPSFAGFTEFTSSIPKLYWDVKSQEQRILAICKMLDKVICYADMLGENVDEIAHTMQEILDGKLDPMIIAAIAEWFENNEPQILQDIDAINAKIGEGFDAENTVASAIADVAADVTATNNIIGNGFSAQNTVADAIANTVGIIGNGFSAQNTVADAIAGTVDIIGNGFSAQNTVADAISDIDADGWVTTDRIADQSITPAKIVNKDIFLIFGDSWGNFVDHENWSIGVNDVLRCGQIINYAYGGATFASNPNLTIQMQINKARLELTQEQKNNVRYVIIMAGVNDHHPNHGVGFFEAVEAALVGCKNDYPNAIIQWFPTSCAPTYDNSQGPKWLYCCASFWYFVSRYISSSVASDLDNRYSFPSCGTAFYWNWQGDAAVFFSDGLHLSKYGQHAIVNAILDGYGKCNMNWIRPSYFSVGTDGMIQTFSTPTSLEFFGSFTGLTAKPDISFGTEGQRILLAMTAEQCQRVTDGNLPIFYIKPCMPSGENATADGYAGIFPVSPYVTCNFDTSSAFDGGTRYICK